MYPIRSTGRSCQNKWFPRAKLARYFAVRSTSLIAYRTMCYNEPAGSDPLAKDRAFEGRDTDGSAAHV
jgi:hypothetical protein